MWGLAYEKKGMLGLLVPRGPLCDFEALAPPNGNQRKRGLFNIGELLGVSRIGFYSLVSGARNC